MSEISNEDRLKMLISLQEGFRASLSQLQGRNSEIATKGSYGLNSLECSAKYDRDSHSLRTYQTCLPLTEGEPLTESLATFHRSGMIVSGILYQLPPLVRIISETGSGLLPTPDTMPEAPNKNANVKHRPKSLLECARQMWPTPRATRGESATETMKMWRTPLGSDGEKSGWGNLPDQVKLEPNAGGQLNPTWVEWLMGYPTEWTVLDASETQLFRKSRKSSLKKLES
jgi:hypothetical protein